MSTRPAPMLDARGSAAVHAHRPRSGRPARSEPTAEMLAAREVAADLARRGYWPSDEAVASVLGVTARHVRQVRTTYARFGPWPKLAGFAATYPCKRESQAKAEEDTSDAPYIFPIGAICHIKSDEPDDYRPRPFRAADTPAGDFAMAERRSAVGRMLADWRAGRLPRFLTCGRGRESWA